MILANGDEVVTTPEHPWLATVYSDRSIEAKWVATKDLVRTNIRYAMPNGGERSQSLQPCRVMKQLDTWSPRRSYDAGWLAGIFDGEGSLSFGEYGSPKMQFLPGSRSDIRPGRGTDVRFRVLPEPHRSKANTVNSTSSGVGNLYVTGGFPGLLRALGELRPIRLLTKWEGLDISTRTVEATKIPVVAVEDAGCATSK